jgi:hypothetical protein
MMNLLGKVQYFCEVVATFALAVFMIILVVLVCAAVISLI